MIFWPSWRWVDGKFYSRTTLRLDGGWLNRVKLTLCSAIFFHGGHGLLVSLRPGPSKGFGAFARHDFQ